MKLILLNILAVLVVLLTSEFVFGQPGLPGDPDQAPIDGGLTLLAAAGGAYAIKKLRDKRSIDEDSLNI